MYQRGIRGAITVDENTVEAVNLAVVELISEMKNKNNYKEEDISHVIFTMTEDLDCVYPAKAARDVFKEWSNVPMMCMQELKIKNSLEKCLRILIILNTSVAQKDIKHVYLKGAKILRKDLT